LGLGLRALGFRVWGSGFRGFRAGAVGCRGTAPPPCHQGAPRQGRAPCAGQRCVRVRQLGAARAPRPPPGVRIQDSGFRVWSSGFKVQGSGFEL
jgi:hypothetical protein